MKISEYLAKEARKYGQENMIVRPGDIVMSDCGSKGILRRVKIVKVYATLISRFNGMYSVETREFYPIDNSQDATWILEFTMRYVGQRLKKDGTILGDKTSAFFLNNFITDDGTAWKCDIINNSKVSYFNHHCFSFIIEGYYNFERREYVC